MSKDKTSDSVREQRILMEIVVDAHGPDERAMGWYYEAVEDWHDWVKQGYEF